MGGYRNSVQIVVDLLKVTEQSGQEGVKTTSLLTKANLSHPRFTRLVDKLTGSGLVNKINYSKRKTIFRVIQEIPRFCRFLRP